MDNNKRNTIKKLAIGATALTGLGIALNQWQQPSVDENCDCIGPNNGQLAQYFTNAMVETHRFQRQLFYNDLLKDKIVMINFMSIDTEEEFHPTARLTQVQKILGDQLGKDYFIYSITTDPEKDTAQRLNEFADSFDVQEGWSFITGTPEIVEGIKSRFFMHPVGHHGHDHMDCSMGLMRYGNARTGTWGSVPHGADPNWIIKRLEWVRDDQAVPKTPKRGGPYAVVKGKPWVYDSGNFEI
jgi:hypothetical protein